jgi:hypothetical protein
MVVTILLFAANRELQDPCTHLAAAFSDDVSRQASTVKLSNKMISVRLSEDLLPLEKIRSVFLAYMRCCQSNHRRCHCDMVSESRKQTFAGIQHSVTVSTNLPYLLD